MQIKNTKTVCGLLAALALLGAGQLRADQQLSFGFEMPLQVKATVNETGCDNSPGPEITLEGEIALGGMKAQLIFQNNVKGTHTTSVTYSTNVVLALPGGALTIPKQPVRGGVGGNPWIWIQFIDANGAALSDEIYLGRCVQGLNVTKDFLNTVAANTTITGGDCNNKGGPTITFGGTLSLSGMKARFIFRNNEKGVHTAEAVADVALILNGTPVTIPKQPVRGGAGGNPLIWVQFLQGNDIPIGQPVFLGRCNQI